MGAVLAVVLAVIAMILQLVGKHTDWIIWLALIAIVLVAAEVAWGWHRAGYYHRTP